MDQLKTILVFCNDSNIEQAIKTGLQIEYYDHAPVMVSTNLAIGGRSKIRYTVPGKWDLKSLHETNKIWLARIVALRGDVDYDDNAITLILAKSNQPINYFYYRDDELVAFSVSAKDLKKALATIVEEEYADENDWHKLFVLMRAIGADTRRERIQGVTGKEKPA